MDEPLRRLASCAKHLRVIDQFFSDRDREYSKLEQQMRGLPGFDSFARSIYSGTFDRQMQLSDLLTYVLVSRGGIWGFEEGHRSDYLRILLLTVNELLLQEHVTYFPNLRRDFQNTLDKSNIDFFIEDEEYRSKYEEARASNDKLTYKDHGKVYRAVDRLIPKVPGTAVELIVYLYLLRSNVGYVIPLLLQQRLLGKDGHLVPPDFLVMKQGRIFGIEVEQLGATGKIQQSNAFMTETGIPVLTGSLPKAFPFRCPVCDRWILFCDNIIEKFSDLNYQMPSSYLTCDTCNEVVYFGRIKAGEDELHYHYRCISGERYVKNVLSNPAQRAKRLRGYFPYVDGLGSLVSEA